MKRSLLLTLSTIALASISQAQITKGTILFGGGVSIISDKSEDNTNTEFKQTVTYLTPSAGIAIRDNLAAGLSFYYSKSNYKHSDSPDDKYFTEYGGGVFLRKYLPIARTLYLYGEPELIYTRLAGKSHNATEPYDVKGWNSELSLSGGLSYAISKRFHLEAGLPDLIKLSYGKRKDIGITSKSSAEHFRFYSYLSAAIPFSIGFRVVLPK